MPLLIPFIPWLIGAVAVGGAVKVAGNGVEDAADGTRKLLFAVAAVGAVYLIGKKQRAW